MAYLVTANGKVKKVSEPVEVGGEGNVFIGSEADVLKMSTTDVVLVYNSVVGEDKAVKKFENKTVAAERLMRVLEERSSPRVGSGKPISDKKLSRIKALLAEPRTIEEIATSLGVKWGTARDALSCARAHRKINRVGKFYQVEW